MKEDTRIEAGMVSLHRANYVVVMLWIVNVFSKLCVKCLVLKLPRWLTGVPAAKPDYLSPVLRTHMVKGKTQLL